MLRTAWVELSPRNVIACPKPAAGVALELCSNISDSASVFVVASKVFKKRFADDNVTFEKNVVDPDIKISELAVSRISVAVTVIVSVPLISSMM
jgi:hypothetical protein